MPLLYIILALVAIGVILWLVEKYIPMNQTIKNILMAVVIIVIVIWLMKISGLWEALLSIRI